MARYPENPERTYYATLCEFFSALNPATTAENGFACILLLESGASIRLKDGRVVEGNDPMGSIEDSAYCIALFFENISTDPIWWKATYPTRIDDPAVRQSARALLTKIKSLEIVHDVKEYF